MMGRVGLLVAILSATVWSAMATPARSLDVRRDAHRWEHRLLVVFSPSDPVDLLDEQNDTFGGHAPGFRDRDLLLVVLRGDSGTLGRPPAISYGPAAGGRCVTCTNGLT